MEPASYCIRIRHPVARVREVLRAQEVPRGCATASMATVSQDREGTLAHVRPGLDEIGLEELRGLVEDGGPLVLVDALPPIAFAASHLPGAVNIPEFSVDELVDRRIPDLESLVVVYCANPDCESSVAVAGRLVELGYRNVRHFSGGKDAWRDAGLPLEGGRA